MSFRRWSVIEERRLGESQIGGFQMRSDEHRIGGDVGGFATDADGLRRGALFAAQHRDEDADGALLRRRCTPPGLAHVPQ